MKGKWTSVDTTLPSMDTRVIFHDGINVFIGYRGSLLPHSLNHRWYPVPRNVHRPEVHGVVAWMKLPKIKEPDHGR